MSQRDGECISSWRHASPTHGRQVNNSTDSVPGGGGRGSPFMGGSGSNSHRNDYGNANGEDLSPHGKAVSSSNSNRVTQVPAGYRQNSSSEDTPAVMSRPTVPPADKTLLLPADKTLLYGRDTYWPEENSQQYNIPTPARSSRDTKQMYEYPVNGRGQVSVATTLPVDYPYPTPGAPNSRGQVSVMGDPRIQVNPPSSAATKDPCATLDPRGIYGNAPGSQNSLNPEHMGVQQLRGNPSNLHTPPIPKRQLDSIVSMDSEEVYDPRRSRKESLVSDGTLLVFPKSSSFAPSELSYFQEYDNGAGSRGDLRVIDLDRTRAPLESQTQIVEDLDRTRLPTLNSVDHSAYSYESRSEGLRERRGGGSATVSTENAGQSYCQYQENEEEEFDFTDTLVAVVVGIFSGLRMCYTAMSYAVDVIRAVKYDEVCPPDCIQSSTDCTSELFVHQEEPGDITHLPRTGSYYGANPLGDLTSPRVVAKEPLEQSVPITQSWSRRNSPQWLRNNSASKSSDSVDKPHSLRVRDAKINFNRSGSTLTPDHNSVGDSHHDGTENSLSPGGGGGSSFNAAPSSGNNDREEMKKTTNNMMESNGSGRSNEPAPNQTRASGPSTEEEWISDGEQLNGSMVKTKRGAKVMWRSTTASYHEIEDQQRTPRPDDVSKDLATGSTKSAAWSSQDSNSFRGSDPQVCQSPSRDIITDNHVQARPAPVTHEDINVNDVLNNIPVPPTHLDSSMEQSSSQQYNLLHVPPVVSPSSSPRSFLAPPHTPRECEQNNLYAHNHNHQDHEGIAAAGASGYDDDDYEAVHDDSRPPHSFRRASSCNFSPTPTHTTPRRFLEAQPQFQRASSCNVGVASTFTSSSHLYQQPRESSRARLWSDEEVGGVVEREADREEVVARYEDDNYDNEPNARNGNGMPPPENPTQPCYHSTSTPVSNKRPYDYLDNDDDGTHHPHPLNYTPIPYHQPLSPRGNPFPSPEGRDSIENIHQRDSEIDDTGYHPGIADYTQYAPPPDSPSLHSHTPPQPYYAPASTINTRSLHNSSAPRDTIMSNTLNMPQLHSSYSLNSFNAFNPFNPFNPDDAATPSARHPPQCTPRTHLSAPPYSPANMRGDPGLRNSVTTRESKAAITPASTARNYEGYGLLNQWPNLSSQESLHFPYGPPPPPGRARDGR